MPKPTSDKDLETTLFLLQCLASASENAGKPDFKTIGSTLYAGATGNAMYLRLLRVKKSVNFVDAGMVATAGMAATAGTAGATDAAASPAPYPKPYGPTASLPANPVKKQGGKKEKGKGNGNGGLKRKAADEGEGDGAEVGVEGDGEGDGAGKKKKVKVEEEEVGV